MQLDGDEARARLVRHEHGILATTHPRRGADAVPTVYAIDGDYVGIGVDQVKPKASSQLQRERNLAADPRASLLAEHYDANDWSQLWWARAHLRWVADPSAAQTERLAAALQRKYEQYAARPFHRVLVFEIYKVTGWAGVSET
ncbi:hypothetical protein EK0264_03045 [Epidermidibacterium keratini]|uniref:TIGR03668 family PPOX class F420-dependent oxidoreductase n=1 Tax=Epidermidibacterium keratini TaxID=1891644 RepID=A0A7L4YJU6_9ACTN|nr:hypothetical protein [Epidermidibacterium keratini]QHB99361.1 hypothetical protein EK0264_03045 [Epidermidibacterium keratini]